MSELSFIQTFGQSTFDELVDFINDHGLMEEYQKAKVNPTELAYFAFKYGIIEILVFCYCSLKISLDFNDLIENHYNNISPKVENNMTVSIRAGGSQNGLLISTLDSYSEGRLKCYKFLIRMKKFSTFKSRKINNKIHFLYEINPKWIEPYNLLTVF